MKLQNAGTVKLQNTGTVKLQIAGKEVFTSKMLTCDGFHKFIERV